MSPPIIRIINASRIFRKSNVVIPALHNIDLEINESEFISVTGRSGSGKSTLLNLLGGLDTATSGRIFFRNKVLSAMSRKELALYRRFSVGMIFQSFNLIGSLSAWKNVELPLIFGDYPLLKRKARAVDLLKQVGMEHRQDHLPSELSGGEAQRVAIARALANDPEIILADEPTGNLDNSTSQEIIGLLSDMNRQKKITIIMVTHDRETAESVSCRIVRLSDGRIAEITNLN
jgi:putative ABC transport system ATP-binding protein